jgi:bifunctional non-homologous end joining protein LigD
MLIRKNTKAFKTILELVTACQTRPDREKLIRLYITRAGHTIKERISVEGIQGDAAVFYEMNYQAVLTYLQSSNHQLHISDDVPGIYFFRSTSNKVWDEMPFEFDEAVKKEFASLPELPALRKKEKVEKYVFPTVEKRSRPQTKKENVKAVKPLKIVEEDSDQPRYKLKHKIAFTDLETVIYRQPKTAKKDVLDYYDKISEYLLPYLKERPLRIRFQSDRMGDSKELNSESLVKNSGQLADWIQATTVSRDKVKSELLLCNDRDHLLFYVERGCVQFDPGLSKIKSPKSPDYMVISLDGDESELIKTVEVALAAREIFTGLRLPTFLKTDGKSGLHVYIPLDAKSDFDTCKSAAELICKLVQIKSPGLAVFHGTEDVYGKVVVDYSVNEEGKGVVAPYSLSAGDSPTVATPLSWDEVVAGMRPEDFNSVTMLPRLKKSGDIFESFYKKKVNADDLQTQLYPILQVAVEIYSFRIYIDVSVEGSACKIHLMAPFLL